MYLLIAQTDQVSEPDVSFIFRGVNHVLSTETVLVLTYDGTDPRWRLLAPKLFINRTTNPLRFELGLAKGTSHSDFPSFLNIYLYEQDIRT